MDDILWTANSKARFVKRYTNTLEMYAGVQLRDRTTIG